MNDETAADESRRRFASVQPEQPVEPEQPEQPAQPQKAKRSKAATVVVLITALAVPLIYFGTSRLNGVSTRSSRTASIGTIAPAIALPQADGSTWELGAARKDGPVVLVFLRGFF